MTSLFIVSHAPSSNPNEVSSDVSKCLTLLYCSCRYANVLRVICVVSPTCTYNACRMLFMLIFSHACLS